MTELSCSTYPTIPFHLSVQDKLDYNLKEADHNLDHYSNLQSDFAKLVVMFADPNSSQPDETERSKAMSSPAPLLRPPIPGGNRSGGGARTPRLGLAIPPSPSQKPVAGNSTIPDLAPLAQPPRPSSRPTPPRLQLATPMGSNTTPQEGPSLANGRPPPQPLMSSAGGVSDASGHSRSDSFTMVDGRTSGPTSASSSGFSAMGSRQPAGTPDPASAISSVYSTDLGSTALEREGSNHILPDLEKLSLEKGRDLDVEDLDDDGWKAASEQKQIVEVGSLGEGAGGAVTRCRLKKGKTEFALKVFIVSEPYQPPLKSSPDNNHRSKPRRQKANKT